MIGIRYNSSDVTTTIPHKKQKNSHVDEKPFAFRGLKPYPSLGLALNQMVA